MKVHNYVNANDNVAQFVADTIGRQEITEEYFYTLLDLAGDFPLYVWISDEAYRLGLDPWRLADGPEDYPNGRYFVDTKTINRGKERLLEKFVNNVNVDELTHQAFTFDDGSQIPIIGLYNFINALSEYGIFDNDDVTAALKKFCEVYNAGYYAHEKHCFNLNDFTKRAKDRNYMFIENLS